MHPALPDGFRGTRSKGGKSSKYEDWTNTPVIGRATTAASI
ncbi:MAG TPA: hypothetical protein VH279_02935 [Solirubrobacteraceae bacterium]|jgi:hypothetical protein|nr:hypothetical protein [Solirubrobacteraceae bacterium]